MLTNLRNAVVYSLFFFLIGIKKQLQMSFVKHRFLMQNNAREGSHFLVKNGEITPSRHNLWYRTRESLLFDNKLSGLSGILLFHIRKEE